MKTPLRLATVCASALVIALWCSACGEEETEPTPPAGARASGIPASPASTPDEPADEAPELEGEIGFVSMGNLRVVDAASGEARDLVADGTVQGFGWSADGSAVIIARASYPPMLEWMAIADGTPSPLPEAGMGARDPRCSPSGEALAFVMADPEVGTTVHLMAMPRTSPSEEPEPGDDPEAEEEPAPLAPEEPLFRVGSHPVWSPDGAWLLYEADGQIRTLRADGEKSSVVSLGTTDCSVGDWSPDGQRVVYSGLDRVADGHDLFISTTSGDSRGDALTTGEAGDVAPIWSPDGSWVAFLRPMPPADGETQETEAVEGDEAPSPLYDLWIVNVQSGEERKLLEGPVGRDPQPRWAPRGGWIAATKGEPGGAEMELVAVPLAKGDDAEPVVLATVEAMAAIEWRPAGED
jgi:dipeptidyl aminopeptidase/acylaminoacyl peptidase